MINKYTPGDRVTAYWYWVAGALFLLITVDFLMSVYAGAVVGLEHESNPFMRWLLGQSLWLAVAVHIAIAAVVAFAFKLLFLMLERSEDPFDAILGRMVEVYLGVLVAAGLFIFANNFLVIVFQRSLL